MIMEQQNSFLASSQGTQRPLQALPVSNTPSPILPEGKTIHPSFSVSEQITDENGALIIYQSSKVRHLDLNSLMREAFTQSKK